MFREPDWPVTGLLVSLILAGLIAYALIFWRTPEQDVATLKMTNERGELTDEYAERLWARADEYEAMAKNLRKRAAEHLQERLEARDGPSQP